MSKQISNQNDLIRTSFEIRPFLYYGGLSLLGLGAILGLLNDIQRGNIISIANTTITLVLLIISFAAVQFKKMDRNNGLGLVMYAATYTFLGEVFRVYQNPALFSDQFYTSLVLTITFIAIAGFVVSKYVSIVASLIAFLIVAYFALNYGDAKMKERMIYFTLAIAGLNYMIVFYRSQLEKLFQTLHSSREAERQERRKADTLKKQAEQALEDLQAAQKKIIVQEKMASLGALTAGIAHEIKNPLNFVTNFSESSVDLMDELKGHLEKLTVHLNEDDKEDVTYLLSELEQNMKDINDHGKRGDRIVKNMLMHSRGDSSTYTREDLNILLEECMHLAFHGMRAQDQGFKCDIDMQLDEGLPEIDMIRTDLSRVFLNIMNNGFYSAHQKSIQTPDIIPVLKVRSSAVDATTLRVVIEDNGTGIPDSMLDQIFTPFFTTKPTGKGTGLGLSISFEIIRDEHSGSMEVESDGSSFARFIITLPVTSAKIN